MEHLLIPIFIMSSCNKRAQESTATRIDIVALSQNMDDKMLLLGEVMDYCR